MQSHKLPTNRCVREGSFVRMLSAVVLLQDSESRQESLDYIIIT